MTEVPEDTHSVRDRRTKIMLRNKDIILTAVIYSLSCILGSHRIRQLPGSSILCIEYWKIFLLSVYPISVLQCAYC